MKMYSTYYDNVVNLEKDKYTYVRVSCVEPPESFTNVVDEYVDLSALFAPSKEFLDVCHPTTNWEGFKPRYIEEVLGKLDKEETRKLLEKIYVENGEKPLMLCCFEAPPYQCHRQLIGPYLGLDIEEI